MNNSLVRAILITVSCVIAASAQQQTAPPATFNVPPRDFPAELDNIALGDFNNDGILDIAGTYRNGSLVYVYLGKGNAAFAPRTSYEIGGINSQIALADINGDGKLDIITADSEPGSISMLLGAGDGTFGNPITVNVAGTPSALAIGDVNGDGEPDIVVSDRSGQISLLLSAPRYTFLPLQQFAIGGDPQFIQLADFNHDGKLDIAELDAFTGNVLILIGNGDGTFRIGPTTHTAFSPVSFAALDLNHDGFADIVVPNSNINGALIVLLGKGDGAFQPAARYATSSFPANVAFGDFNADGKLDVITTSSQVVDGGGASVLFGNGDGTFGAPQFSVAPIGAGPVAVGDLTGDGKLDAVIASTDYISILRGAGNGYFINPPHYNLTPKALPLAAASADFNLDGKPDLVTATYPAADAGANSLWIQLGNGDSTFQPALEIPLAGRPASLAVADFNHDGKPDIAVIVNNPAVNYTLLLFLGNGDGTFQVPLVVTTGDVLEGLTAGDFNHDGKIDLAFSTGDSVSVLPGNGDGTFRAAVATPVSGLIYSLNTGDFNHDGNLDLAAVVQNSRLQAVVDVLLGNGNGTFQTPTAYRVGKEATAIVVADLNGDGILDLATANVGVSGSTEIPGSISVLIGNSDGTFQREVSWFAGNNPVSIAAADLNGDGIPDLVAANFLDNNLVIFLGAGDGTFSTQVGRLGTGYQPQSLVVIDLNGDGKPDIAVSTEGSTSVLTNTTAGP